MAAVAEVKFCRLNFALNILERTWGLQCSPKHGYGGGGGIAARGGLATCQWWGIGGGAGEMTYVRFEARAGVGGSRAGCRRTWARAAGRR